MVSQSTCPPLWILAALHATLHADTVGCVHAGARCSAVRRSSWLCWHTTAASTGKLKPFLHLTIPQAPDLPLKLHKACPHSLLPTSRLTEPSACARTTPTARRRSLRQLLRSAPKLTTSKQGHLPSVKLQSTPSSPLSGPPPHHNRAVGLL
jgi:hypothetical protein